MASLAESVISGGQQQAQQAGRSVGDAVQAYHIASTAENSRLQLKVQQDENERNKGNWLASQMANIAKNDGSPETQKILINSLKGQLPRLMPGMDPNAVDVIMKDADSRRVAGWGAAQAIQGQHIDEKSFGDMSHVFGSPEAAMEWVQKMADNRTKIQAQQMGMAQARMQMLEETKRQHGLAFSEKAALDPIIVAATKNNNSLIRSEHILTDPTLPVTSKDLNLAYQDYSNAVNQGGAATEGQIHRDLPDTWVQDFNELQQKAGTNADLRKTKAGAALIDQLRGRITGVKGDLSTAAAQRADVFHNMAISSGNPYVAEAGKGVLMQHAPSLYMQKYGGKAGAAASAPATPAPSAATAPAPAADWSHVNDDVVDALFNQHVGNQQAGSR